MSHTDPWDDLLNVIGQGWPHYKNAALPLIGINSNQNSSKQNQNNQNRFKQNSFKQKNNSHTQLLWLYLVLNLLYPRATSIIAK